MQRESYAREEANTVIGNSVHASFARRKEKRKEKREEEKGKRGKKEKEKKLSLESIAFIIRESHDNEKATRAFTPYFERHT